MDENDLNAIVSHIMGNPQEGSFDVNMADVNKDGNVNAPTWCFLPRCWARKNRNPAVFQRKTGCSSPS